MQTGVFWVYELLRSKADGVSCGEFFCEPFIPAASCWVFWFKNKRPYSIEEIKKYYPQQADKLLQDPCHLWRATTGIELIHKEPSFQEQVRIWGNWQLMTNKEKKISDRKSLELFGITNFKHQQILASKGDALRA